MFPYTYNFCNILAKECSFDEDAREFEKCAQKKRGVENLYWKCKCSFGKCCCTRDDLTALPSGKETMDVCECTRECGVSDIFGLETLAE